MHCGAKVQIMFESEAYIGGGGGINWLYHKHLKIYS